ncbi:MAG: hypothetical protein IT210_07350 [Armatimonadetes bacterium]|nr:hypothetical protein [Armatimonadota bacterium]
MKLGQGSHTYEVVEGWAKLPEGVRLGYTHGIVADCRDNIYIYNQSEDAVIALDRDGNFLGSWGEEHAGGAHGMFLNREGDEAFLYLVDNARRMMVKTTLDGREIYRLTVPPLPDVYPDEAMYRPTDVAVAPNGDVYICDGYGESWIHRYDATGIWLQSWGGKGAEPGKMNCPHGVWVDTRGEEPFLLAADRGNNRIQIFSLDGEHRGFVTDELRMPCCFYQFEDALYIPDLFARVTILDSDNKLITHLGDNPGVWETPGWPNLPAEMRRADKFNSPHALCVDSRGDIYVAEWISDGRLTKLKRTPA